MDEKLTKNGFPKVVLVKFCGSLVWPQEIISYIVSSLIILILTTPHHHHHHIIIITINIPYEPYKYIYGGSFWEMSVSALRSVIGQSFHTMGSLPQH